MHNWSIDTSKLSPHTEAYQIWRLEQLINYGLNGEKLDRSATKKYFSQLELDPYRREFIASLIHE